MRIEEIAIRVGEGLSTDELLWALKERKSEIESFLVGDVTNHDARATYSDDSFEVEEVNEGENDSYIISYSYGWEAYWGCKDMNNGGNEYVDSEFIYSDGIVTFRREFFAKPDTHEEF